MSNALRIARRLKLPRELLKRAQKYLRRRQRRGPETDSFSKSAREAELSPRKALKKQHEADVQRQEYEQKSLIWHARSASRCTARPA